MRKSVFVFLLGSICLSSICLSSLFAAAQSPKSALSDFLNDSAVKTGHAGVSVYDPSSKKYLLRYNAEKNFIPSSNVKLFTLYAGLKYLGDSLTGLRWTKNAIGTTLIFPTGDPTFLHEDFQSQPVFDFLQKQDSIEFQSTGFYDPLGEGWSWDDYNEEYMVQRSEFPIYGNLLRFYVEGDDIRGVPRGLNMLPPPHQGRGAFHFTRDWASNTIGYTRGDSGYAEKEYHIPMAAGDALRFLSDTMKKNIAPGYADFTNADYKTILIKSRPVDSLFKPMMFNSDNFFAEQTLLMASNEKLGFFSNRDMIDFLLKNDLAGLPQKPRWVDGSGLSRYNLFSPNDLFFSWESLKQILVWNG